MAVFLTINQLDGDWELAREHEQIIADVIVRQESQTAMEIIAQEIFIRLVLENMADCFEFGIERETRYFISHGGIDQWHLSDYAPDQRILRRECQQPIRLIQRLPGLHSNGAGHSRRPGSRF